MSAVPYFAQWESADLVGDIVAGRRTAADDPHWARSGARDLADYVRWTDHICGMACLKMILAHRTGRVWPLLDLARLATRHGGYAEEADGNIRGLIYAPCVAMLAAEFDIPARIVLDVTAADIPALIPPGGYFIASVHPAIRWPERAPPSRGGHLILVTGTDGGRLRFHNPSGHTPATQADATLEPADFDRFFAGRGMAVG